MLRSCCVLIVLCLGLAACDEAESPKATALPHQIVKEAPPQPAPALEQSAENLKPAPSSTEPAQEPVAVAKSEDAVTTPQSTQETVTGKTEDKLAPPVEAPPGKSPEAATGPAEITLIASNGNITFTHGQHAATFACSTCHSGTPAAFGLDKELAHTLCKGCHKDNGAGPTGCRDCHVK